MSDKKRVFKDLVQYEPYECLNSEITGDYNDTHAVKCVNGIFVGTEENGVASWLGIPYAKSPVGKRRFNGTNISEEIYAAVQQMWTNFARCGNPSTDQIEWKEYSADDQNVMVIAGPGNMHIERGLLADQYKAVLPLLGYYQFMDKFFTPRYLLDIVAARK